MKGKTFCIRFLHVGIIIMSCLSLMLIVSGCRKKNQEVKSENQVEKVQTKKEIKEVVKKEPLNGMTFELELLSVSVGDFSGPSIPRLLSRSGRVRRSQIKIDGIDYDVFLAPYNGTDFCLIPKSNPQDYPRWTGAQQLRAMHLIGGKYYSFNKTPDGDKLLVRPYEGDFGTIEVGAGQRNIQDATVYGSLRARDSSSIAVGGNMEKGWPAPVRSCQLPVGDYSPIYLSVLIGKVRIDTSENYYRLNNQNQVYRNYKSSHSIKIRQDKPFVLDFSTKPQILIVNTDKDQHVRLGHELKFEAVLVDPKMDIMIRRIYETTKKEQRQYTTSDGQQNTVEVYKSIEPKVLITRTNGKKVAEGVMPFG